MTLAYVMPKSDNLNILGSHDTQMSEPGTSWPSCISVIPTDGDNERLCAMELRLRLERFPPAG